MFVPEPGYHLPIGDKRWEVREVAVDKMGAETTQACGFSFHMPADTGSPTMTLKLRAVRE